MGEIVKIKEMTMKPLTINDNSQSDKSYLIEKIPQIVKKVADRTLEELEKEGIFVFPNIVKETSDLTKEQMILQSYNDKYYSTNVMGFLGYGNERLIIKSRFSSDEQDYFFKYLLERVLLLPNILELETDANPDSKLFQFFIFLFPYYLKKAVRKGLFKTYIHRSYNDYNLKGVIDIPQHIKKNIPFVGKIAYSQREHSCDNDLIELIRHTIEFIKKKPYGKGILVKIKDEITLITEITNKYNPYEKEKIIIKNKKNTIRHAYYHEYRILQRLCILILQNQKHQIGSGMNKIYGILFDGAWLWEEYMDLLVGNLFYHPMNKGKKGVQHLFAGGKGRIYPDFISMNNSERIIADAKYKPIDNIRNQDYFQMLAYMMRFEAKTGIYFYPEQQERESLTLWLNTGSTYEKNVKKGENIKVIKHRLKIPNDAKNYREFCEKMEKSEEKFKSILEYNYENRVQ